jgi:hypothetical protein
MLQQERKDTMHKAFAVIGLLALAGCSTTSVGHRNPEFTNYRLRSTAVAVADSSEFGIELENRIAKALTDSGVSAFPTREIARFAKSQNDYLEKIWAKGAVDILVVQFGDAGEVTTGGYQVVGSSNTVGATTHSNATAVPMRSYSRQLQMRASVITRADDKVWEGDTKKFASGLLFTGDGAMMSGSVDALIEALEKDKLIK